MNAKSYAQSFSSIAIAGGLAIFILMLVTVTMAFDDPEKQLKKDGSDQPVLPGSAIEAARPNERLARSQRLSLGINSMAHGSVLEARPGSSASQASSATAPTAAPAPDKNGALQPLTAGGKFRLFLTKSFLSPGAYVSPLVTGAFGEWTDDDHHHHSEAGDFALDSLTRAARGFAFGTTANFFEKFAYASIFKQDPRYRRSDKKGMAKIGYAVSRVFITQSDNGTSQPNVSFLAGGLTAAGIANAWERDERRDAGHTMKRWGSHIGITAGMNVLREFFGRR
jgi:hypothetical protein